MDPIIRQATLQDLDGLVNLENACFDSDHISRQSFRSFLKKKSADVYVAEINHQIIGNIVLLYRKNSDIARIYTLAVHKNFRQHGIALRLCKILEKRALEANCRSMILEVHIENENAIRFYQKLGYYVFGKYLQFYEDHKDALRMKKDLTWDET